MAASRSASVRARIERICAADEDARTLRLRLLEELARTVPFDAYAWVLTDPETTVGSAPLADVPALAELPELVRLRYCTALNRWTTLVDSPVAFLAEVTGGRLERSLLWRDLLCRYGVADVASVVFRDRFGCWAFLELWRTGGAFGSDDAALLRDVVVPITAGLRRSHARTFTAPPAASVPGPLVLLLTPRLAVVRQTPATADPLRILVPRDDAGPTVPAGAYNVAAQLLAVEAGVDAHEPRARVHLADGTWLTLRAARLDGGGGDDIAVTIEQCAAPDRLALFGRCSGLTGREQELLGHLAAGDDTREVAARMHLSAHTVQDHLKSVFDKTGTRSRRALLARALGG